MNIELEEMSVSTTTDSALEAQAGDLQMGKPVFPTVYGCNR